MGVNKKPLNRSITVSSAVFFILLALILSVVTYFGFRDSVYERYQVYITDLLDFTSSRIDDDDLANCIRTGEKSEKYLELQTFLDDVYVHCTVHYIYIIDVVDQGGERRIMDVLTALSPQDYADGDLEVFTLGTVFEDSYDQWVIDTFDRIKQKGEMYFFEEPSEWGVDYTGVLPLKDSSGRVYALMCVDLDTEVIQATLLRHTIAHLLLIILLGGGFIVLFVRWIRCNVTLPIQELERSVVHFATISHKQRDPALLIYHEPEIHTQNEVESLSHAVAQMSVDLKNYALSVADAQIQMESMQNRVDRMGQLAYKDSLTKVRNKAAYLKQKNLLNRTILTCTARFCIIMVDLNNLKKINDTYGHKHGDQYLLQGAELVCSVCEDLPVFRIGGDEFVVVLEGEAYDRRDAIINRLREAFHRQAARTDLQPWERCSAAIGAAVFMEDDHTVDAVFKRADSRMYANKRAMKAQRE